MTSKDENDENRAREIGVKGFLKKPVATGDLSEMVRKMLDEGLDTKSLLPIREEGEWRKSAV